MDGPDIKLGFAQRARAIALAPQVVENPEWACDAIIWQRDRIATLESQLAASEAKCAELELECENAYVKIVDEREAYGSQLAAALTRAEEAEKGKAEAERLAVWAAENHALVMQEPGGLPILEWINSDPDGCVGITIHDNTPAGILAALALAIAMNDKQRG